MNVEMQCVDTGDLDSRSITYAAQLISQHTKKGFSYNGIWIIRDKLTHGPLARRHCPMDTASVYLEPNMWGYEDEKFADKMKIIFIKLEEFENEESINKLDRLIQDWRNFLIDKQNKITSEDDGIREAQYLWMKLSSDKEIRSMIRAREKYALSSKAR